MTTASDPGPAAHAAPPADSSAARVSPAEVALLASVFVVAACGLVYELAAGALASYLLGDSVLQFSTVIGVYLFAMGAGLVAVALLSSASWWRTSCASSCWWAWSAA